MDRPTPTPADYRQPQTFVLGFNDSIAIPPYGVVRVQSIDSNGVCRVALPDARAVQGGVLFNSSGSVEPSQHGQFVMSLPAVAACHPADGQPSAGDVWGTEVGGVYLRKDINGFRCLGRAGPSLGLFERVGFEGGGSGSGPPIGPVGPVGPGPMDWVVTQVCPEFSNFSYVAPGESGVITPEMLADERLPARLIQYPRLRRVQSALGTSVNVTGTAGFWTDVLTVTAPVAGVYVVRYDARTYIQAAAAGTGAYMFTRVSVGGSGLAATRRFSAWAQTAWAFNQETVSCEHGPITLAGGDVVTLQATAGESPNPWAAQLINDQTVLSLIAIEGSTLNINGDADLAP